MIVMNFILIHMAPGDPVLILVGQISGVTPGYLDFIRHKYGLDLPIYVQLYRYVATVLRGDLGYSYFYQEPVLNVILERLPATLLLMVSALSLASILGIVLGVISSKKPYSLTDSGVTVVCLLGYSLPVFWLGQVLLLFFAMYLGLFPVGGMFPLGAKLSGVSLAVAILHRLVLPAVTLSFYYLAMITRLTRASMLEVFNADYVVAARSKGLPERIVTSRYVLRNALIPVVTVIGMSAGYMIAGSVLVETIFDWPGDGRLIFDSIVSRDYPTLMGMFVVLCFSVILANLFVDILYSYLDPRVRYK